MNIVHFLPTLAREGYGVTTVVEGLVASQRHRGHTVAVSTLADPVEPLPSLPVDVVHQHMIWLRHGAMARRLAARHRAPLVITPHGALDPWARRKSAFKKAVAWQLQEQRRLQNASCLQATSPFEVSYFRDLGLRPPIAQIPNGLPLSLHPMLPGALAEPFLHKHPELRGRRCLLFLSRITPQKGLLPLLAAFHAFSQSSAGSDWHLLIAGSDQDGYLAEVQDAVCRLGLSSAVLFLPPLYGVEKQQVMAWSEAFILPSLAEGFPMVVLEAMASGLPVICTTASPWMDLPSSQAGWWVEPTVEGLAAALASLGTLSAPDLAAMGRRARALIERSYSQEVITGQLDQLYSWLCGLSSQPGFVVC